MCQEGQHHWGKYDKNKNMKDWAVPVWNCVCVEYYRVGVYKWEHCLQSPFVCKSSGFLLLLPQCLLRWRDAGLRQEGGPALWAARLRRPPVRPIWTSDKKTAQCHRGGISGARTTSSRTDNWQNWIGPGGQTEFSKEAQAGRVEALDC